MFDELPTSAGTRTGSIQMKKGKPYVFDRKLIEGEEVNIQTSCYFGGNFAHGRIVETDNDGWMFQHDDFQKHSPIQLSDDMNVKLNAKYVYGKVAKDGDKFVAFGETLKVGQLIAAQVQMESRGFGWFDRTSIFKDGVIVSVHDEPLLRLTGEEDMPLEGLIVRKVMV